MAPRQNCWDFMKCGREPGGIREESDGTCPAATCDDADGLNGGRRGGRICWAIAGTFSHDNGDKAGTFARQIFSCTTCDFFQLVDREEGVDDFNLLLPDQLSAYQSRLYGKRRAVRLDIHLDLELLPQDSTDQHIVGVTRNFSLSGLSFVSEDFHIPAGRPLTIRLNHPQQNRQVSLHGLLTWKKTVRDRCLAGVKLMAPDQKVVTAVLQHPHARRSESFTQ